MPNGPSTDFLAPFLGAGFGLPQGSGPGLLWGWGWDFHQAVPGKPHQRDFVLPDNKTLMPGYHMLFALNTHDIPSAAKWVLVQ